MIKKGVSGKKYSLKWSVITFADTAKATIKKIIKATPTMRLIHFPRSSRVISIIVFPGNLEHKYITNNTIFT
jgi:hypothetical protein